jgi:TupA-like ATPgrasp
MLGTRQRAVLFFARLYLLAAHPVLTFQFLRKLEFWPNPGLPQRYHEKMLWRKMVDHNPRFVDLSDKLAAKQIAQARCPELAVANVLWTGTTAQSLPANLVVRDVAVKTNHGWAMNVFVADSKPRYAEIVTKAERWMRTSHHRRHGEWGYRNVPRRIFVEEKLVLGGGDLPTDIKVHTFGCQIGHVWVADKLGGRSRTYNADGVPLAVRDYQYRTKEQALPDTPATRALVAQAIELAPRLIGGLDYARVDFMVAGARLYFGEYTLYPGAGYDRWLDSALIQRAEALWDLRRSDFLRKPHRGLARLYAEALRAAIDGGTCTAQAAERLTTSSRAATKSEAV